MTAALARALESLAPADLVTAVEPVSDATGLYEVERHAVARAVPIRQAEFAAGRRAARQALLALGESMAPISSGEDRAPRWPPGLVGSIAHDSGFAMAVVARQNRVHAVGLDLTPATGFPVDLRPEILKTDTELALDGLGARAAFAAKEALFKALFPLVGRFFGFEAAEARPDIPRGTVALSLLVPLGPFDAGAKLEGRIAVADGRLLALIVLGQRATPVRG